MPDFWGRSMQAMGDTPFLLIDIGCAGGIDGKWCAFGDRLRAIGFDPNVEEVARLNAARPLPTIEYIPGFVGLEPAHPFQEERREAGLYGGNPWDRLAIAASLRARRKISGELSNREKTKRNLWPQVPLADHGQPIYVPQFLRDRGVCDIDFIKLDIDGLDFDMLHSLRPLLDSHGVLAFQMEVNFYGRANSADHTFHNTDLFLRRAGFDLVDLTVRRYSLAALPQPYLGAAPGESAKGRPYQGDALYVRDVGAGGEAASGWPPMKLLKLAAIFHLNGLADHAAEILVNFRDALSRIIDVTAALDDLAGAAMADPVFASEPKTYARYLQMFHADDPRFYPRPEAPPSLRRRIASRLKGAAR